MDQRLAQAAPANTATDPHAQRKLFPAPQRAAYGGGPSACTTPRRALSSNLPASASSSSWDVVSPSGGPVRVRSCASIDAIIVSCGGSPSPHHHHHHQHHSASASGDSDGVDGWELDDAVSLEEFCCAVAADGGDAGELTMARPQRVFELLSGSRSASDDGSADGDPLFARRCFDEFVPLLEPLTPEQAKSVLSRASTPAPAASPAGYAASPSTFAAAGAAAAAAAGGAAEQFFLLRLPPVPGGAAAAPAAHAPARSLLLRTQLPASVAGSAAGAAGVLQVLRRLGHAIRESAAAVSTLADAVAEDPLAPAAAARAAPAAAAGGGGARTSLHERGLHGGRRPLRHCHHYEQQQQQQRGAPAPAPARVAPSVPLGVSGAGVAPVLPSLGRVWLRLLPETALMPGHGGSGCAALSLHR